MRGITGNEIKKLLESDIKLRALYKNLLPSIQKHVSKNSGTLEEANDLFQESMIVLFRKANDPEFLLTSSLETFIYSIAKRKWLYELKKKSKTIFIHEDVLGNEGNEMDEIIIKNERTELYIKHFKSLSAGCQKLLKLFFSGATMAEIANQLDFASDGYARKRKHNCQQKLIQLVQQDLKFEELKYD